MPNRDTEVPGIAIESRSGEEMKSRSVQINAAGMLLGRLRTVLVRLSILAMSTLLTLYLSPLHAQSSSVLFGVDLDFARVGPDTPVSVHVNDQVTGGCWLTADAAKAKVKRELLDAGFVDLRDEDEIATMGIFVSVVGFALESSRHSCAVAPFMQALLLSRNRYDAGDHVWMSFRSKVIFTSSSIMSGSRSGMSERINAQIASYIDEFIVALHEEKQHLAEQVYTEDIPNRHKTEILNAARPLRQ